MAGRILIVDGVATNRILLRARLAEARYQTALAENAEAALALMRAEVPDVILLDAALHGLPGLELLRRLRADPLTADIAAIVMLPIPNPAVRLAALRAGADDVMTKPLDEDRLLAKLRALLRARETTEELRARDVTLGPIGMTEAGAAFDRPGLVALVTDRPGPATDLRKALAAHLPDRLIVQSRDAALSDVAAADPQGPDLYVIDADLDAEGGGLRLMSDLRSRGVSRHASVCMMMAQATGPGAAMAFDLGANDVVAGDADPRELALRLGRLLQRKRRDDLFRARLNDGLRMAVIDPLTGLFNRRYALAQLGRIAERAWRGERGFAVLVIDLDRFKSVNDAFGHAAGDSALIEVARRLAAGLRPSDLLGRIGGEEFLVALPETGLPEALALAQRLCRSIEETPIRVDAATTLSLTVSIGLAISGDAEPGPSDSVTRIVGRADQALMRSKAGGRNQITISRSAA
jgi:two-component system, cell cycle response regulator